MTSIYWAAKEPREAAAEAVTRVDEWFEHVRNSGLLALWRRRPLDSVDVIGDDLVADRLLDLAKF